MEVALSCDKHNYSGLVLRYKCALIGVLTQLVSYIKNLNRPSCDVGHSVSPMVTVS
jgi:hypothetical protein